LVEVKLRAGVWKSAFASYWRDALPRSETAKAALIFLAAFLVYVANGRVIGSSDTVPARYLPLSILREFKFDLDEFTFLYDPGIPYLFRYHNGHIYSAYPPGSALVALPFYVVPVLFGMSPQSPWLPFLEKVSAATIAALSVAFLYLALNQLVSERASLIVTGVYALGTSTFSTSSQALWQHGPSQFFLTVGLYLLIRGLKERRLIPWSGFAFAAAVLCRQTNVIIVLPILVYLARYHRAQLLKWMVFALPPTAFYLSYNYALFGSIFETGYGSALLWTTPFLYGLLGILVSPSNGLFVYSPILLLAGVGIYSVWRQRSEPLFRYLSLGPILVVLLYSKWYFWWGGWSYGPRLLADITPVLSLYLLPIWSGVGRRPALKALFILLAITSVGMHAIGAFAYDASWYTRSAVKAEDDRLWSWRDSPFAHYGKMLFLRMHSALRRGVSFLPTSQTSPQELSASLAFHDIPHAVSASNPIAVTIRATNTGRSIWLFRGAETWGTVSLGWRWLRDDHAVPFGEGRARLARDVFPGDRERLTLNIWPPSSPGEYTLELGMVSEHVAWFSTRKIPLQVTGSCDFETVMGRGPVPVPDPPRVALTTDGPVYQSVQVGVVRLGIWNPAPRTVTTYFVVRRPDATLLGFSSGDLGANPSCLKWIPTGISTTLPRHFRTENFPIGLVLTDEPRGLYTVHLLLMEPNTTRVITRATTTFFLPYAEPHKG
jgi:hypothetical protein